MKVTLKGIRHVGAGEPLEMELHQALEPGQYASEAVGAIEELAQGLDTQAEAMGRLLAWLVESDRLTLDDASQIAHGRGSLVEPVAGPAAAVFAPNIVAAAWDDAHGGAMDVQGVDPAELQMLRNAEADNDTILCKFNPTDPGRRIRVTSVEARTSLNRGAYRVRFTWADGGVE